MPNESTDLMDNVIRNLLMAQRCAQVHHWKVKSFAMHLALGELYESLVEITDALVEMYMGANGQDGHIEQSDPNHFNETDPLKFIQELHKVLGELKSDVPEGFLTNKFEELQGEVARTKYKLENLK